MIRDPYNRLLGRFVLRTKHEHEPNCLIPLLFRVPTSRRNRLCGFYRHDSHLSTFESAQEPSATEFPIL